MFNEPAIFCGLQLRNVLHHLNALKLKTVLSVPVPRGLQMFTVVAVPPKELSMLSKTKLGIDRAADIKLAVDDIADLVDDRLRRFDTGNSTHVLLRYKVMEYVMCH